MKFVSIPADPDFFQYTNATHERQALEGDVRRLKESRAKLQDMVSRTGSGQKTSGSGRARAVNFGPGLGWARLGLGLGQARAGLGPGSGFY
jgi:hypothetical protein